MLDNPSERRIIVCLGVYGSGSTWAFNAVRLVLNCVIPIDQPPPLAFYSDHILASEDIAIRQAQTSVIKSHVPHPSLKCFAREAALPTVITIRDPRDCVVSMMQRFQYSFEEALDLVVRSSATIPGWVDDARRLVFRYEDSFTKDPSSLDQLANHLKLRLEPHSKEYVHSRLLPTSVQEQISTRFPEAIEGDLARKTFDPESHWHPRHLGDGAVGKFRDQLEAKQIRLIEASTWRFCQRFGYPPIEFAGLPSGTTLDLSSSSILPHVIQVGFNQPEPWGAWISRSPAKLCFPILAPARRVDIAVKFIVGAALRGNSLLTAFVKIGTTELELINGLNACTSTPSIMEARLSFEARIDSGLCLEFSIRDPAGNNVTQLSTPMIGLIELTIEYS